MTFPITSMAAIPLFLLVTGLSLAVSFRRGKVKVALGDGGDPVLLVRIRRHANFAEAVPVVLIVMGLAEAAGANATALGTAGAMLVLSRVLHPFGLRPDNPAHPLRIVGAAGTSTAGLICAVALAVRIFGQA